MTTFRSVKLRSAQAVIAVMFGFREFIEGLHFRPCFPSQENEQDGDDNTNNNPE
jgi:hypothetical protein